MRWSVCFAFAGALLCTVARADETGPQVLEKMDHALNALTDGTFESRLLVHEGAAAREYGFVTIQKVPDRRLVRFTSPGDVKGMGVLVENAETLYVYLPGFQKVRRMGTHVKNQTFMGSDFSFEDMSQTRYGLNYDAQLLSQDDAAWTLELKAKDKKELEFPHLKVWVDKTTHQPTRIEYYDQAGKKLKTQLRSDYKKDSPEHYNPGKVVVIDHRRNDHTSEIIFTSSKLNTRVKDDVFSVRSLVRGQ